MNTAEANHQWRLQVKLYGAQHTTQKTGHSRLLLYELQDQMCWFCGRVCQITKNRLCDLFTIEHLIPRRWNGLGLFDNIVGCCHCCNQVRAQYICHFTAGSKELRDEFQRRWLERSTINELRLQDMRYLMLLNRSAIKLEAK